MPSAEGSAELHAVPAGPSSGAALNAAPDLVPAFLASRPRLLGFLFTLTRNFHAAEEIVQELSLAVLREAARGTKPDNFHAWVMQLARHRVADYFRAQIQDEKKRRQLLELAEFSARAFTQSASASDDYDTRLALLRACLEQLTPRVQRMLDARYHRAQSIAEIASHTAWTTNAVTVALAKARAALARCITQKSHAQGVK